jgi:hypothetical protein
MFSLGTLPAELPATMRRAMITLSAAQRLHIYEYCIQTARAQNAKAFVDEDFMLLEDKGCKTFKILHFVATEFVKV